MVAYESAGRQGDWTCLMASTYIITYIKSSYPRTRCLHIQQLSERLVPLLLVLSLSNHTSLGRFAKKFDQ